MPKMSDLNQNVLEKLETDITKIKPTAANLDLLISKLYKYLEGSNTPAAERAQKARGALTAMIKQGQVTDPQLALAGVRELGQAVLDSGIPQAALIFAVTYKLVDGLANAPQEARDELKVTPY